MQLLPVSNNSGNGTYESRTDNSSGRDNRDFMKLLTESLSARPAEVTPNLDIATSTADTAGGPASTADTGIPLDSSSYDDLQTTEAPYSESVESNKPKGADTPVEEIRLTDNELNDVIKSLREQGADDETLARVAALMGNPGGIPVTDVVKAVANVSAAQLTDGDLQRIGSLADRLDATGELKNSLLEDLKGGRTAQAMARFTEALNKALGENSSQKITADKNELLALGKALKLDAKTMEKLEKAFGSKDSKTLSMADFKELLVPMGLDMAEQNKQQEKIAGLLEKALKPAVDKARQRLQKEAEAAGAADRRTEQSETLIRDTVTRTGLAQATSDAVDAADAKAASAELAEKGERANAAEAKNAQGETSGKKDQKSDAFAHTEAAKKALDEKAKAAETVKAGKTDKTELPTQTAGKTKTEDPWEALLRKLDVKTEVAPRTPVAAEPVATPISVGQSTQNVTGNHMANLGNSQQAARVLSQVEQGMFSALTDGTKKLTLNLNPVELGAVSVVLSSRNGEVSAVLKPERSDTAAMLAQQVDALRANLEQQGIKVDKVDVQTPQQQNQNNSWQGMDQHNASQEQQARQEALDRMRRVHRMRDAEPQTFSSSAQAMRHAARANASGGLNLVA